MNSCFGKTCLLLLALLYALTEPAAGFKYGYHPEAASTASSTKHPGEIECEGPRDSDECLQKSPGWTSKWTCKNAIETRSHYCDLDSWAKDLRRCCPDTCGTGALTESECNDLTSSKGTCQYPNDAQCPDNRWTLCTLATKDSDMCLQNSKGWGEIKDGKYEHSCANSQGYCGTWPKDMKRCCPDTCENSEAFTEEVCKTTDGKGECRYPFKGKYEECDNGWTLCTLATKDSDMCLQSSKGWGEIKDGKYEHMCANSQDYCGTWPKDMKRCCPDTCENSEAFTEEVCKNTNGKGECQYPFKGKYEECDKADEGRFAKSSMGTLCNLKSLELQTEDECKIACAELGFPYDGSYDGPGDFPKCQYTEGHFKTVCHFNTSPSPGRSEVNSKYSAICKKAKSLANWILGEEGETCNEVCSKTSRVCNPDQQSSITTNELVAEKMLEAGYTCKSFVPHKDYPGTPFSTGRISDDCAPIQSGTLSVCNGNKYPHHRALCYCEDETVTQGTTQQEATASPPTTTTKSTTTTPAPGVSTCACSNYTNGDWGKCNKEYKDGPICYVVEPSNCPDLQPSSIPGKHYSWDACTIETETSPVPETSTSTLDSDCPLGTIVNGLNCTCVHYCDQISDWPERCVSLLCIVDITTTTTTTTATSTTPTTTRANVCDPNPCHNGGNCTVDENGERDEAICECAPGYEGQYCCDNINDCEPNPCLHDGICVDEINGHRCECLEGFYGDNCVSCNKEKDYDVGFLLDVSGSICNISVQVQNCKESPELCKNVSECVNWGTEKEFTKRIAEKMNITANGNRGRGSVVTFAGASNLEIKFSDNMTKEAFDGAIDNLTYTGRTTNILGALEVALNDMFNMKNGMRHKRVEKVLVLITDGRDQPSAKDWQYEEMVAKFKKRKITIVVIGIGNKVKDEQLLILAPHDYHHFANFTDLDDRFAGVVVEDVCTVHTENSSTPGNPAHSSTTEAVKPTPSPSLLTTIGTVHPETNLTTSYPVHSPTMDTEKPTSFSSFSTTSGTVNPGTNATSVDPTSEYPDETIPTTTTMVDPGTNDVTTAYPTSASPSTIETGKSTSSGSTPGSSTTVDIGNPGTEATTDIPTHGYGEP